MIDRKNSFDQPVKSDMRRYDNVQKITTVQGDGYTTGCQLDYKYFPNYYKMIAIDLRKQQAFDVDPKAIQQIDFTGNLDRAPGATLLFIIEGAKDFSQETVKVL